MLRFFVLLCRAACWAALLAGSAASVGAAFGSRDARLDLIAHFAPVWAAAVLAGVLGLRLLKPGRVGRVAGVTALVGVVGFLSTALPELRGLRRVEAGAETVRVLQFNVWASNLDPAQSAAAALKADPDIIVVQEGVGPGDQVFERLKRTHPHGSPNGRPHPARILSKRPGRYDMIWEPGLSVARFRTRTAGGRPVTVLGVHYQWPEPLNAQARQRRVLGDVVRSQAGDVILTGDFNSTPWSDALKRQDEDLARSGLERRTRAVFSWPARVTPRKLRWFPFPLLPIDHVYASRSWGTVEVRRLERTGSDHYPVLTVLSPPPP